MIKEDDHTSNNDINFDPNDIINLAEQMKRGQRLQKLQHDHELLVTRSEIEGIDNQSKIKEIEKEISELKQFQKSDQSKESDVFRENFEKQAILKERLSKLLQKRKTVQPEVYRSLKDEYESELRELTNKIDLIIKQIEIARQQTQPLIQVLKYRMEELLIRKDIENMPEEEFIERKNKLETEIDEKEAYLTALEYLVQQVK
jgi:hypothetical protein